VLVEKIRMRKNILDFDLGEIYLMESRGVTIILQYVICEDA
jgi:hypothetical protein